MINHDIKIRGAVEEDLITLRSFEQGIIQAERPFTPVLKDDPVHYYDLSQMLADANTEIVVLELNGEPVACGYARIEQSQNFYSHKRHAYLGMMYVAPMHRGKGLIEMILTYLKESVKKKGIQELRLDVFSLNHSAIKAYEKAGFGKHMIQMRMHI